MTMLAANISKSNWLVFGLFLVSLVLVLAALFAMKIVLYKRKVLKHGFEGFGNKKLVWNFWNLILVIFILFVGVVGALITGALFFGAL